MASTENKEVIPGGIMTTSPVSVNGSADGLESVVVFCGNCSCGCPELFIDHQADDNRKVVLTDDFGQRVQMSTAQLATIVADVKAGRLDHIC